MKDAGRFKIKHFILFFLLIILDQATKYLVHTELQNRDIRLIPDVLQLTFVHNTGAGFGIFKNQVWPLIIMVSILLLAIFWYYFRIPKVKKYMPIVYVIIFIAAGAAGNLIDRIRQGFVTDFIYFELIDFPVFNVADIYITVSCFLFAFLILCYYKNDEVDFLSWKPLNQKTGENEQNEKTSTREEN